MKKNALISKATCFIVLSVFILSFLSCNKQKQPFDTPPLVESLDQTEFSASSKNPLLDIFKEKIQLQEPENPYEEVKEEFEKTKKTHRVLSIFEKMLTTNPCLKDIEDYPDGYKIWSFTKEVLFKEKGATFLVNGRYPQIDGFEDIDFQVQVNKALKSSIENREGFTITVYPKSLKEVESYFYEVFTEFDAQYGNFGEMYYTAYFPEYFCFVYDYVIPMFTTDLVSIIYTIHFQIGCTAAYDCVLPITIDIKNKKIYQDPQTLFNTKDYWATIQPLFTDEIIKSLSELGDYTNDCRSCWLEIEDTYRYISFALSPEGLLVMYDENEMNSLETMRMVCIPYEKVNKILHPEILLALSQK